MALPEHPTVIAFDCDARAAPAERRSRLSPSCTNAIDRHWRAQSRAGPSESRALSPCSRGPDGQAWSRACATPAMDMTRELRDVADGRLPSDRGEAGVVRLGPGRSWLASAASVPAAARSLTGATAPVAAASRSAWLDAASGQVVPAARNATRLRPATRCDARCPSHAAPTRAPCIRRFQRAKLARRFRGEKRP